MLQIFELLLGCAEALMRWRFLSCFLLALLSAYIAFNAGIGAVSVFLAILACAGIVGIGIYWELTAEARASQRKKQK